MIVTQRGAQLLLAATLVLGMAARAEPTEVRVTDPGVQRALEQAVEQVRKQYGGKTPVPGVLIGVCRGPP